MTNGLHKIPISRELGLSGRNHVEFMDGDLLVKMIREELMARRISIDGCRDIIHYLRDHDDPTCHRLIGVLAVNGQRATDVANHSGLVVRQPPQTEPYG